MPLKGKTVYITGGTGGIGRPLVERLQQSGAAVIVHDLERDGDLVANIGQIASYLSYNTPDILINMAGYNAFGYCEDQDIESLLALNLVVPIKLTQAVLPAMKRRGSGHIVNMSSMTAAIPLPHFTGYVAAKAGLKAFSDALRREVKGSGVTVTTLMPRAVKTGMNSGPIAEINQKTNVTHDEPQAVAERIYQAITGKEREMRIGWPERFFAFMNAVFPGVIDSGLKKNRRIGEEILERGAITEKCEKSEAA